MTLAREVIVPTPADAADAAAHMDPPVVLKLVSRDIVGGRCSTSTPSSTRLAIPPV